MLSKFCFSIWPHDWCHLQSTYQICSVEEVVQLLSLFDEPALHAMRKGLHIVYNGVLCSSMILLKSSKMLCQVL